MGCLEPAPPACRGVRSLGGLRRIVSDVTVTLAGEGRLIEPGGSPVRADPGTAGAGANGSGIAAATSAPPSALRIVLDADSFAFDADSAAS
jgi:hypothetical protein